MNGDLKDLNLQKFSCCWSDFNQLTYCIITINFFFIHKNPTFYELRMNEVDFCSYWFFMESKCEFLCENACLCWLRDRDLQRRKGGKISRRRLTQLLSILFGRAAFLCNWRTNFACLWRKMSRNSRKIMKWKVEVLGLDRTKEKTV